MKLANKTIEKKLLKTQRWKRFSAEFQFPLSQIKAVPIFLYDPFSLDAVCTGKDSYLSIPLRWMLCTVS